MKCSSMAVALLSTVLTAPAWIIAPAMADGNLKIVDKPLELTIHLHWPRKQRYDESWPVEQATRKLTNIHLKDKTAGSNSKDSLEAFNLLLAGGDLPDIVGGYRLKDNVNKYGPEGAFLPLNPLIEKHAPNIKAFFDARPELRAAISAADGNMYYIPYLPDGKYGRAYFMRKDWLEKLGLKAPETLQEYYETLVAFRDGDPNGNGEKDEIPYFARQWEEMIRLVTLWDARTSGSDTYHDFYVRDGKITHGYAEAAYREGIKNLAKWYAEGLIDPEVFTRGSSSRDYLLSQNLGGATHDWFASTSGYNTALADTVEGFSFRAIAPPASISGVRKEEHRRTPIKPDGWAISYQNEHPVETIKYFDFFFTPEGRNLANFGVEGVHWDMGADGKAKFKKELLTNGRPINSQLYDVGAQIQRGYWQDYNYEIQWSNSIALEGIALYDEGDYLIDQFLGVAFNEAEQKIYDKYWSSIRTYMLERQQAWILGTGDVEADWDDYLSDLKSQGLGKVIKVMQSAYKRQYGG